MKNRDSAHPGRIKLTPVDAANGIYDLVRADEPRDPGTPLNKKLLDYAVAACGVTAGTATAYTLDDEFGGFELVDGATVNFRFHVAPREGATLNVNGTGDKLLSDVYGVAIQSGIPEGAWITATYSAIPDTFIIKNGTGTYGGALEKTSWDTIARISEAGLAQTYWDVGDEKRLTIMGETLALVIVGFDHDTKSDGTGKAGITFGLKDLMSNFRQMNDTDTNVGGFENSVLYQWMRTILETGIPEEVSKHIKTVNKETGIGGSTASRVSAMKTFLFSQREVGGTSADVAYNEGSAYNYFATNQSRIKYINGTQTPAFWWLRSPSASSNAQFSTVNTSGTASPGVSGAASRSLGVCFGFCI